MPPSNLPEHITTPCVGCRLRCVMPPYHVIAGRLYCESCIDDLTRVLLAVVHHIQENE